MPAPSASDMVPLAIASYGMSLGAEAIEYLNTLFEAVSSAWGQWQNSISFDSVLVSGAGIGAWAGVGNGGSMKGAPFQMSIPSFKNNSPQQIKFTQGLVTALNQKFTPWPNTYKFTMLNYVGVSGATPVSPGPVSASNLPATLQSSGSGGPLSGIADVWIPLLTPPDFDLDNPQAKSKPLIKSIAGAIEKAFLTSWLAKTMATASVINATGTPGAGAVTGFPSQPGGKLV